MTPASCSFPETSLVVGRPSAHQHHPDWKDARLLVHETYLSVQGESTFVGVPCVFVRLTGCPLRCVWCDTEHAFFGGERLRAIDVVNAVLCFGVDVVEVTGGEPLAQPSCISLLQGLVLHQRTVLLETSGSICIQKVPREVRVIMDLKCPGSGEVEKNNYGNVQSLLRTDEVKFVVSHREDFLWAANQVRELGLADRVNCVLMSPVFGKCDPRELVEWILEDRTRGARMQIQVHKTIWPPDTRGV